MVTFSLINLGEYRVSLLFQTFGGNALCKRLASGTSFVKSNWYDL